MKVKEFFKNKNLYLRYIPMSLTAMCILFFAVKNALYPAEPESFNLAMHIFKTLPTLVTLAVQLLLMSANKYGFLLGGINAATYGIVYILSGAPFSATSALLISFPLQIYSFFNWKKHADGNSAKLRTRGWRGEAVVISSTVVGCQLCYWLLLPFFEGGQQQVALDIFLFVIGLVITVLALLRYVETPYYNLISAIANLVMWILICVKNVANLNYVIMAAYSLFRVSQSVVTWTKQYQKSKNEEPEKAPIESAQ